MILKCNDRYFPLRERLDQRNMDPVVKELARTRSRGKSKESWMSFPFYLFIILKKTNKKKKKNTQGKGAPSRRAVKRTKVAEPRTLVFARNPTPLAAFGRPPERVFGAAATTPTAEAANNFDDDFDDLWIDPGLQPTFARPPTINFEPLVSTNFKPLVEQAPETPAAQVRQKLLCLKKRVWNFFFFFYLCC